MRTPASSCARLLFAELHCAWRCCSSAANFSDLAPFSSCSTLRLRNSASCSAALFGRAASAGFAPAPAPPPALGRGAVMVDFSAFVPGGGGVWVYCTLPSLSIHL